MYYILIFPSLDLISLGTFPFEDCAGTQWTCQCLCHLTNFLRYSSWPILYYRGYLLQFMRFCFFWGGKTTFCAIGHSPFYQLLCLIQSDMLNVYHSSAHLFFFSPFSSSMMSASEMSQLQHSSVPAISSP